MRSLVIRMVAAIVVGLCGGSCVAFGDKPPGPTAGTTSVPTPVVVPAPPFRLLDLNGKPVKLTDFTNKALLVVFWTTWAEPCRAQLPALVALQKQYGGDGFTVLGISLDDKGANHVKEFAAANQLSFPILMADAKVVQDYGGLTAIPTIIVIDRNHFIHHRYVEVVEQRILDAGVRALLLK